MPDGYLNEVRSQLASDFRQEAESRLAGKPYPVDEQKLRATMGLRQLATYIQALPDDDVRLQAIAEARRGGGTDPTIMKRLLDRYGYGYGPSSHPGPPDADQFLTALALEWARQEAVDTAYRKDPNRLREQIARDPDAKDVIGRARRRKHAGEFRRLLDDDAYFDEQASLKGGKEAVWQSFFEDNHWIFGGSLSLQFLHAWAGQRLEQTVVGASVAGAGKRVDALMRTAAGRMHSVVFVEIKHHRTCLLEQVRNPYRPGIWAPSRELVGGVAQVQGTIQRTVADYRDRLQGQAADGSEILGDVSYLIRPRGYLVIGHLDELYGEGGGPIPGKLQSFELCRRHLQEPEIITFDELLARAEGLLDIPDV
jgi:hypothetical protein